MHQEAIQLWWKKCKQLLYFILFVLFILLENFLKRMHVWICMFSLVSTMLLLHSKHCLTICFCWQSEQNIIFCLFTLKISIFSVYFPFSGFERKIMTSIAGVAFPKCCFLAHFELSNHTYMYTIIWLDWNVFGLNDSKVLFIWAEI